MGLLNISNSLVNKLEFIFLLFVSLVKSLKLASTVAVEIIVAIGQWHFNLNI